MRKKFYFDFFYAYMEKSPEMINESYQVREKQ